MRNYRLGEDNLPKKAKRGILWTALRQHLVHVYYAIVAPLWFAGF